MDAKVAYASLAVVFVLGSAFIATELTSPERKLAAQRVKEYEKREAYDLCMDKLEPKRKQVETWEGLLKNARASRSPNDPFAWRGTATEREIEQKLFQLTDALKAEERTCELIKTAP